MTVNALQQADVARIRIAQEAQHLQQLVRMLDSSLASSAPPAAESVSAPSSPAPAVGSRIDTYA